MAIRPGPDPICQPLMSTPGVGHAAAPTFEAAVERTSA
jgi:hypothetical protein